MDELIKAMDEYIQLLTDELNDIAPFAATHGWQTTRFEKGRELRDRIDELKKVFC